jgi:hypothetical protein
MLFEHNGIQQQSENIVKKHITVYTFALQKTLLEDDQSPMKKKLQWPCKKKGQDLPWIEQD